MIRSQSLMSNSTVRKYSSKQHLIDNDQVSYDPQLSRLKDVCFHKYKTSQWNMDFVKMIVRNCLRKTEIACLFSVFLQIPRSMAEVWRQK